MLGDRFRRVLPCFSMCGRGVKNTIPLVVGPVRRKFVKQSTWRYRYKFGLGNEDGLLYLD